MVFYYVCLLSIHLALPGFYPFTMHFLDFRSTFKMLFCKKHRKLKHVPWELNFTADHDRVRFNNNKKYVLSGRCTTSLFKRVITLEGNSLVWVQRTQRGREEKSLRYHSMAADPSFSTVPGWGHPGVRSDILSNCIILLSMLKGYVIFHRSLPIIRAWLSQRDPPDVCDL